MAKDSKELATRDQLAMNDDLLHAVARDVGEEILEYVRRMFPDAVKHGGSSFPISLRNSIHNQIVSVVREKKYVGDFGNGTLREASSPQEWLQWRRFQRKRLRSLWRKAMNAKEARNARTSED